MNKIKRFGKIPVWICVAILLLIGMNQIPLFQINEEETPTAQAVEVASANNSTEVTTTDNSVTSDSTMTVHFIDVGQGDCTLVGCDGEYMLIDAGPDGNGTKIRNYLKKQGVDKLKILDLTHSDADHIGSAASIVANVPIDTIWMCQYEKDNKTYNNLINEINYKSYKWSTPSVGDTYSLGSAIIQVVAPNKKYNNPNDSSIAIIITHGTTKWMFTGDCEETAEADIIINGINIDVDVYQVGHHGSNTSTSQEFLDAMSPTYAVISCGEGNHYGHPRSETLIKFQTAGIKMYRTDDQGTIVAISDGANIIWDKPESDNWTPGEPTGASSK